MIQIRNSRVRPPDANYFRESASHKNNPGAATKKLASMPYLQHFPKDQPQLPWESRERGGNA